MGVGGVEPIHAIYGRLYSNEAATAQQVDEMLGYDRQADDESQDDMIPFEELATSSRRAVM